MIGSIPRLLGYATVGVGVAAAGYVGLVTGACPLDLGLGRRVRPLGPQQLEMAAPRELVFDVIAEPYLGRTPRALADKLRVLERGGDMVLAAHFTPLGGRLGLVAQTVAASLAAVKAEAERGATSAAGARGSRPDQPPPATAR